MLIAENTNVPERNAALIAKIVFLREFLFLRSLRSSEVSSVAWSEEPQPEQNMAESLAFFPHFSQKINAWLAFPIGHLNHRAVDPRI